MGIYNSFCQVPKWAYSIQDVSKVLKVRVERIEQLCKETLNRTISSSPYKDEKSIEKFFNTIGKNDTYINAFYMHRSFEPIAQAIRMTIQSGLKGKNSKAKKVSFCNFYISKSVFNDYVKYGKRYVEVLNEVRPFKPASEVKHTAVKLPLDETVVRFKEVVNNLKVPMSVAVVQALAFFMESNPKTFGKVERAIDESQIVENKTTLLKCCINKDLNNKMWKALQRYNQDNVIKVGLTDFIEAAIAEKLQRMPIKYTNPELYNDYKKVLEEKQKLMKEVDNYG